MLRLTVVEAPEGDVEVGDDFVVGPRGASIGRGAENSWCFGDEQRLLSRVHLTIALQGAGFVLADLSTNGVFVNGTQLGHGNCYLLRQGDLIGFGDYEMRIDLLAADELPVRDTDQTRAALSGGNSSIDMMFESDPEQWLLTQLSGGNDTPDDQPSDPTSDDKDEDKGAVDEETDEHASESLASALEALLGVAAADCSMPEQIALVREICAFIEKQQPDGLDQLKAEATDAESSTFEMLRSRLQSLS